jgi:hypothetical protein
MTKQLLHSTRTRLWYQRTLDVLWAAALISLPFTSFPLLVNLTGAIVAPLAAIPVFLLILFWFIPYVLKRGVLPRESTPLVLFSLVALLASALAFFLDIPGYKGRTLPSQELRALVTLVIGLAFYLSFSSWPQNESRLQKTCQWLTIGGIIAIIWTLFQAYFIVRQADQYPAWMLIIQEWLVYISPYFATPGSRVTGFTYEASWFAHQMVILYIPLWLAATYQRSSAFKFRFIHLSLENILLVLGVGLFFMTSPRIGLISFFFMGVFIFLKINLAILRRLVTFISQRRWFKLSHAQSPLRITVTLLTSGLMLVIYAVALAGVIYFASKRDWRMELLVTNPPTWIEIKAFLTLQESVLLSLAHRLAFMERMVYWFTGWHVFNDHPWLGVGLGNAGFFALDQTPSIGWASFEIRALLFRLPYLPNIKSLWVRLFAETGLLGFSIFTAWLVTLFRSARLTLRSKQPILLMIALTGQLSIVALIGEGFSIDSFAMPYYWVAAGLIAAAGYTYRLRLEAKEPSGAGPASSEVL